MSKANPGKSEANNERDCLHAKASSPWPDNNQLHEPKLFFLKIKFELILYQLISEKTLKIVLHFSN